MKRTLTEIAQLVGGALQGDGTVVIEGAASLADATPRDITFLGNLKYTSQLAASKAGAFIVPPGVDVAGRPAIVMKNPPYGWAVVLGLLGRERQFLPAPGAHPTAVIHPSARVGAGVSVGAHTVIEEGAVIGDNTVLYPQCYIGARSRVGQGCLFYPQVSVRENITIGDRCIFHSGVVVGSDGFGYTLHQGRHFKIPQVGTVEIADDVEISANSTVDRAAVGATKIGRGTKIDNLVQIGHNVEIGENCLLVALTGVAGSVKMGNDVTLGAQVGVAGHLFVGDRVMCGARGGISHDIKEGEVVWGVPAQPLKEELKMQAAMRRLPKLMEELKGLRKKLGL